jgi:2-polyprenyl-3-methyl-5-hydroxy-6-metoxy-1,4-benzoquinol methylase
VDYRRLVAASDLPRLLLDNATPILDIERGRPPTEAERASLLREAQLNAERCRAVAEEAARGMHPGARVLEVGIGYLYQTTTLRAVYGDDFELYAIEHPLRQSIGSEWLTSRVAEEHIELVPHDLLSGSLPWDDLRFDVVLFTDVIEHLPPTKVPGVLAMFRERLTPEGVLVMSSTNLSAFLRVASLAFGHGAVQSPAIPLDYATDTYGHIRLYDRHDIEILVAHTGLHLASWRYLNWERIFIERGSLRGKLLYASQRVAPFFARHLSTSWVCSAVLPAT